MDGDKFRDPHLYPRGYKSVEHTSLNGVSSSNPSFRAWETLLKRCQKSLSQRRWKETKKQDLKTAGFTYTWPNRDWSNVHGRCRWPRSTPWPLTILLIHKERPVGLTLPQPYLLEKLAKYIIWKNLFSIKIMIMKTINIRVWLQLFRPLCCPFNFCSQDWSYTTVLTTLFDQCSLLTYTGSTGTPLTTPREW